ncbi:hypothetical protein [Pseudonocardia sp. TRM90224]|uniref:hypothetical protein n=1 Tax=Pseudonocardia sp. TRM90224 TaxID=2812678 RepID=UPI001E5FE541|nr:hypothetical protein [Pseudonocardia sp. TRM90224]
MTIVRPSGEAVARWNTAFAEQTSALYQASKTGDAEAAGRLALSYAAVAQAWRVLAGDLAAPLWARHACAVAAVEFERRAQLESARKSGVELR